MSCKVKFKTSEAATKSRMRAIGAIDQFLNIKDTALFRKKNRVFSKAARDRFGLTGNLFLEENDKAIPNTSMFRKIDLANGNNYDGIREEVVTNNSDYQEEDIDSFTRKIEYLKQYMNVEVVIDSDITTSRTLASNDLRVIAAGKPVILINPKAVFKTTAIHEFGHIFIDSFPGGIKNPRLQKAIELLKGTQLEKEVTAAYPHLSEENLQKEIITTAIGREGSDIWDAEFAKEISTFDSIKNWIFDFLYRTFGIGRNEIESLTRELLDSKVKSDLLENLNDTSMQEVFINKDTNEIIQAEKSLDSVYEQLVARVSIIFNEYKPRNQKERNEEMERVMKARSKNTKTSFERISELKEMVEEYSEKSKIYGLLKYNSWAKGQLDSIQTRLDKLREKGQITPDNIAKLKEYASAFELLEDVEVMVFQMYDKGELSKSKRDAFVRELSQINKSREEVNKQLLAAQRHNFAKLMMKDSNKHETEFLEKHGREWEAIKPAETKEVWVKAKMHENKDLIDSVAYDYYLGQASKAVKDIGAMEGVLVNETNISSTEVQVVSRMATFADSQTSEFAQRKAGELKKHHDEFMKEHSSSNTEEKYKDFVQFNEAGHASLLGEYLPEFNDQYFEQIKLLSDNDASSERYKDAKIERTPNGYKYTIDGKTYNATINKKAKDVKVDDAFISYKVNGQTFSVPVNEAIAKEEFKRWKRENVREETNGEDIIFYPADKWKNPKYFALSQSDRNYLEDFKGMIEEADKLYGERQSLISTVYNSTIYSLPGVTKKSLERVMNGQTKSLLIDKFTDLYKVKEDEFEIEKTEDSKFRKVYADVTNKEKLDVPIPYRYRLSQADQSLDLHSILFMNLEAAKNYEQKKKLEASANLIAEVASSRMTPDYDALTGKSKVHSFSGDDPIKVNKNKEVHTNTSKVIYSIIENRFYGIKEKYAGQIGNFNAQKGLNSFMRYGSGVYLIGNYLNSIVNGFSNTFSNVIEMAGGETYGSKNWIRAKKIYAGDLKHIIGDIGSNVQTSRTNLMMNFFNVSGSANALNNRFSDDNKVKALMSFDSLRSLDHAGEHMAQAQTMYAILDNIQVMNEKGEYIDEKGKVVSKENAATLNDMIEFKTLGSGTIELVINPLVHATSFSPLGGGREQMLFETRALIKKKVIDLYGLYDENYKSAFQREWYGKVAMMLRKWIEPAGNRRLRGLMKSFVATEELEETDRFYSEDLKQYQEGYYTTAIRFIAQLVKAGKEFNLELLTKNFDKLSPHEKSNMKRLAMELGLISVTVIGYAIAGGFDDEPDDETLTARFLLKRMIGELTYFANPNEAVKLVSSPSAIFGIVKRQLDIINQVFDPMEEYETGKNKGRNKLYVKVAKATPFSAAFFWKDLEASMRFKG